VEIKTQFQIAPEGRQWQIEAAAEEAASPGRGGVPEVPGYLVPPGNGGLGLEDHPHQSIDEWQPRAELQRSKKRCFWAERRIKQIMEGPAPNDRSELCPL